MMETQTASINLTRPNVPDFFSIVLVYSERNNIPHDEVEEQLLDRGDDLAMIYIDEGLSGFVLRDMSADKNVLRFDEIWLDDKFYIPFVKYVIDQIPIAKASGDWNFDTLEILVPQGDLKTQIALRDLGLVGRSYDKWFYSFRWLDAWRTHDESTEAVD